jgi:hypothetical protein
MYELDQKLKRYQVSHVASNTRIKRLAIFASIRERKENNYGRGNGMDTHQVFFKEIL